MPEQATRDMQALAVHDRVRSERMPQIVEPRIRHNAGQVANLEPEPVKGILGQRFVPIRSNTPISPEKDSPLAGLLYRRGCRATYAPLCPVLLAQ